MSNETTKSTEKQGLSPTSPPTQPETPAVKRSGKPAKPTARIAQAGENDGTESTYPPTDEPTEDEQAAMLPPAATAIGLALAAVWLSANNADTNGTAGNSPDLRAQAFAKIIRYAHDNNQPAPTLADYQHADTSGVNTANLQAINSALSSATVTGHSVDTTAKLQVVINSYQKILSTADGRAGNAPLPDQADYAAIGVTGLDSAAKVSLLGGLIDIRTPSDVDSVSKLQALANVVDKLFQHAAGLAQTFTPGELSTLGLNTLTPGQQDDLLLKVAALHGNDTSIDSLAKLLALADTSAPNAPELTWESGLVVQAEKGAHIDITLRNDSGASVVKTLENATGQPQAVALTEQELTALGSGRVHVTAAAIDAADNISREGSFDFRIDPFALHILDIRFSMVNSAGEAKPWDLANVAGDTLTFTVTVSDKVDVGLNSQPTLNFLVGYFSEYATYVGGSGSNTLIFQYTLQPRDVGANTLSTYYADSALWFPDHPIWSIHELATPPVSLTQDGHWTDVLKDTTTDQSDASIPSEWNSATTAHSGGMPSTSTSVIGTVWHQKPDEPPMPGFEVI